mgnify:CR=1 FL=1
MKKEITFNYGNDSLTTDKNIIIPRIGETIDISGLLESNELRIEYRQKITGSLYVVDIFHSFAEDTQEIEIKLSEEPTDTSDFYVSLQK